MAKACLYQPKRVFGWSAVIEAFGEKPADLTDEELRVCSYDELTKRVGWYSAAAAFFRWAPLDAFVTEERTLYNVSADLTGDLSGLWGDASGLTGRVNTGTTGNVTGLSGPMDSIWGDVSNIYGVIHTHLYGMVSRLCGCITGKWGYCSLVSGDVTGLSKDLTFFEGIATGLTGDVYSLRKIKDQLAARGMRIVDRFLKNHAVANLIVGDWKRCFGDGGRASGVNTGVVGDVSNIDYDVTGLRFDTAFVPSPACDVPVRLVILPREGSACGREAA